MDVYCEVPAGTAAAATSMVVEFEVPAAAAAAATNGLGGAPVSAAPVSAAPVSAAPVSAEQLDVEAYIARYSGRTRLPRLLFIAESCEVESIELEALRVAHDGARHREDTQLYRDAAIRINGRLGPRYGYDQGWVDSVNRRAEQRKEKLENELNGYKTNLIKESIRMGYNDIGDFYYGHGLLSEAFKSYICMSDYCTTSKHVVQMCMHVILVSIQLRQFANVTNYVSKAEQTPDDLDAIIIPKLRAAAGLAYMETKKYKLAAFKFLETGPELGTTYSEVIAPQDVAIYGALCALASFDRSDLKSKVIDNINFRDFLELVPEVRELVNDFYSSRYGSCLEHLEKLKPNLLLDIHLHEHLETLYTDISHNIDGLSVSMLEENLSVLTTEDNMKIDSSDKKAALTKRSRSSSPHPPPKRRALLPWPHNGKLGRAWMHLVPKLDEMISNLETGLIHLYDAGQQFAQIKVTLDFLLDPLRTKVTASGFDQTNIIRHSLMWKIGVFRDLLATHFSPQSDTAPLRKADSISNDELLSEDPEELYKSLLSAEDGARAIQMINGIWGQLDMLTYNGIIEAGADVFHIWNMTQIGNADFHQFEVNTHDVPERIVWAIERVSNSLEILHTLRTSVVNDPLCPFFSLRTWVHSRSMD